MKQKPDIVLDSETTVVVYEGAVALRHVTTRGDDVRGAEGPEISHTVFNNPRQAREIAVDMWRLATDLMKDELEGSS